METYELAEQDYINGMKYKDIADKYKVSINTVKSWKQRYGWIRGGTTKEISKNTKKGMHTKQPVCAHKNEVPEDPIIDDEFGLSEKARFFCIYLMKGKNYVRAYMKAYGCTYEAAASSASRMLKNAKIQNYLNFLREQKCRQIDLTEEDLIEKLKEIACYDMGDFVEVDKKMGAVPTGEFDGTVIKKVKNGKFGVEFVGEDRLKAIGMLLDYMKDRKTDDERGEDSPVIEIAAVVDESEELEDESEVTEQ